MQRGAPTVEIPSDQDLEDGMEGKKAASPWRIFSLARPEWPWLVFGLLMLSLSLVPFLILPVMIGRILDALVTDKSNKEKRSDVEDDVVFLVIVLLGGSVFALVRSFIYNTAGERVVARLRILLFKAIISQEIGLFDKRKTGELLSRLSTDTTSLQDVATTSISMFFRGIVQLLFNAIIMFVTSWRLTLLVFGVVPFVIISIVSYGRLVRKVATKYSDALGSATDTAQESISNIRTMRSFAGEVVEIVKYTRSIGDPDVLGQGGCCFYPGATPVGRKPSTYFLGVQKQALAATFVAFTSFLGLGALILVVWYGSLLVIWGYLTVGGLVSFMLYSTQIGASVGMMAGLAGSLFVAQGASKRTFQLIDRTPQIPAFGGLDPDLDNMANGHGNGGFDLGGNSVEDSALDGERKSGGGGGGGGDAEEGGAGVALTALAAETKKEEVADGKAAPILPSTTAETMTAMTLKQPRGSFKGAIEFQDVSFAYPSRLDVPVLQGLNLSIPVNATFAFVGASGAGKSTVLSLIERFYEPTHGRILVDGMDLTALDPRYLRRHVALVAQEPVLFALTVAQNIAYGFASARGDPDASPSMEAVESAAKAAFAHDFITAFPEGYNTLVGERGVRLSGGQKQRIAIARALLVDPRVLLLDEATSALDAESEHLVQKAINTLMQNRTTLVVAHRLSTVRNADKILVIANKGVLAMGTHDHLMSTSKHYADLVKRQLQKKEGDDNDTTTAGRGGGDDDDNKSGSQVGGNEGGSAGSGDEASAVAADATSAQKLFWQITNPN